MKSIRNVFSTIVGADVAVQKAFLQKPNAAYPDFSSLIGFTGDANGSVALCFSKSVAIRTASTLIGVRAESHEFDCEDAIGEIANIVAGRATAEFEGLSIKIGLPTILRGAEHAEAPLISFPRLVIPCRSLLGPFEVAVSMRLITPAQTLEITVPATAPDVEP